MKIQISLSARLVKHLPHQPNQFKKQSFSSGSVIPTGSWRESYFTTGKPNSLVIPQQTGSNPLVILRCCSVGYSTMHSFSKLHRGWEWKSSLTHYPTTTTNKYPLVRFRCINVKMTREFGWDGITRWQESYSTSPIPPSYLVVWLGLFVNTNATVILGRLVYLVCHQPSSPSYWLLGLSCLSSTKFTFIFGCLVCLVCYQPISPSYLVVLSISNRDGHISAGIFETMLASYAVQFCWK